jgi:hypothetical protein
MLYLTQINSEVAGTVSIFSMNHQFPKINTTNRWATNSSQTVFARFVTTYRHITGFCWADRIIAANSILFTRNLACSKDEWKYLSPLEVQVVVDNSIVVIML